MESEVLPQLSYQQKETVFMFILALLRREGKTAVANRLYNQLYAADLAMAA